MTWRGKRVTPNDSLISQRLLTCLTRSHKAPNAIGPAGTGRAGPGVKSGRIDQSLWLRTISSPAGSEPMADAELWIEGDAQSVPLRGLGPWLLGRAAAADVQFPGDSHCSRRQARILRAEAGFMLEHLSRNAATVLNGVPVKQPIGLLDGASIAF